MNGAPFGFEVVYREGVELCGHGLWLDARRPRPLAFVSHAHSDHLARHREVIVSDGTARLMRERLGTGAGAGNRRQVKRVEHRMAFGERFSLPQLPGLAMELLPAGHVYGSAQLYVESEAGSLLYTGDFKLQPGAAAPPLEWRHADTLVMETTFGKPFYRLPPAAQVIAEVVDFCLRAREQGAVPVLLAYSLGKAQEALCALLAAGMTPVLHKAAHRVAEIYREGMEGFPGGYLLWEPERGARELEREGRVLVCPPPMARSEALQAIPKRRVAVLSGWALDPRTRYRYGADAAFPLSDHADYDDLLRYVEWVAPRRVLTLHGFAAAFACDLRARGVEAWAISQENQLEFGF